MTEKDSLIVTLPDNGRVFFLYTDHTYTRSNFVKLHMMLYWKILN